MKLGEWHKTKHPGVYVKHNKLRGRDGTVPCPGDPALELRPLQVRAIVARPLPRREGHTEVVSDLQDRGGSPLVEDGQGQPQADARGLASHGRCNDLADEFLELAGSGAVAQKGGKPYGDARHLLADVPQPRSDEHRQARGEPPHRGGVAVVARRALPVGTQAQLHQRHPQLRAVDLSLGMCTHPHEALRERYARAGIPG